MQSVVPFGYSGVARLTDQTQLLCRKHSSMICSITAITQVSHCGSAARRFVFSSDD